MKKEKELINEVAMGKGKGKGKGMGKGMGMGMGMGTKCKKKKKKNSKRIFCSEGVDDRYRDMERWICMG